MKKNLIFVWVLLLATWVAAGCSDDVSGEGSDGDSDAEGDSDADGDSDPDGDSDADGDSDSDKEVETEGPGTTYLTGRILDFKQEHPDFEYRLGEDLGIVAEMLGDDHKPVYAGGANGTPTTNGANTFNEWFNEVEGTNLVMMYPIHLVQEGDQFVYDNQAFFPIDEELFGNEGNIHNYHFTFELHTEFTYEGGEVFTFIGDDDLWVFINERLAIDLGGVHTALTGTADLDALADELQIEIGNKYTLDFFFAERHTSDSHFRIETTITDLVEIIYEAE